MLPRCGTVAARFSTATLAGPLRRSGSCSTRVRARRCRRKRRPTPCEAGRARWRVCSSSDGTRGAALVKTHGLAFGRDGAATGGSRAYAGQPGPPRVMSVESITAGADRATTSEPTCATSLDAPDRHQRRTGSSWRLSTAGARSIQSSVLAPPPTGQTCPMLLPPTKPGQARSYALDHGRAGQWLH